MRAFVGAALFCLATLPALAAPKHHQVMHQSGAPPARPHITSHYQQGGDGGNGNGGGSDPCASAFSQALPTDGCAMGMLGPGSTLVSLQADPAVTANLLVSLYGSTVPLPTLAATSTNQSSEIAALGAISDTAYAGSGNSSLIAGLKGIYAAVTGSIPAGTNVIGHIICDSGCSSASGGTIGSAVPSTGSYSSVNVGGTLRGATAVNPTGTVYAQQTDLTSVNGVTTLTGTGATGTGAQRVTVATDTASIAGSAPGTAGSASANVVTVQGVASMTPILDTPQATENHIGEVGGNLTVVTNAITTTNATTTTGQSIGGKQTLAGMARVSGSLGASGTSGIIQNIAVTFKDAVGAGPLDVYFFNADPSSSTCTNDMAFVLADGDRTKVIGIVHVSDFTASTAAVGQAQQLALGYGLASATSVYACVVARASFAITGIANAALAVTALRN